MLRRRLLLAFLAMLPTATVIPHAGWAQGTQQSVAFVNALGQSLIGIVNGGGTEGEKKAQLASVIERSVDVDGIARFCLGRFWRAATPEQQQAYVQLFHRVLLNNITGHLGDYRGVTFSVGTAQPQEGGEAVSSVVNRPGQAPANVSWVVANVRGAPKIIDVIAEGTSLRLTQRDDYASFLAQNGNRVESLVSAMRRQSGA